MNIVEWNYDVIDAYDGTVLKSGIVKTTENGTRQQAIAKAVFNHSGKTGIQIGWKIKMAISPCFKGETL